MSLVKWVECWWHRKHIPVMFYDANGKRYQRCLRCGVKL